MAFDSAALCVSLAVAVALRMNDAVPMPMARGMLFALPVFVAAGLGTFWLFGLYARVWRFASIADVIALTEATALAILVAVIALIATDSAGWLPTSVPIIQFLVLVPMLACGRIWRRIGSCLVPPIPSPRRSPRQPRSAAPSQRILVAGRPEHVEPVLRQLELASRREIEVVGMLDASDQHVALRFRRVPILGGIDAIEHVVGKLAATNRRPTGIVIAEGAQGLPGAETMKLVTAAQTLGLDVLRAQLPTALGDGIELQPVNLADLLGRPQIKLDDAVLLRALAGRRVLVTGAGGTIGRELVRQIAAIGPAELVLLEHGEFNLYSVELELRENFPHVACIPLLCSIRQRQHVMAVFEQYRPDYVFHAAALKHVPLVEENACAGVLTNVLGTRNVADAAARHGVKTMVQVSTDKAVNPVGVMGATKRLGELYCQALDLEGAARPGATRFMTVRFGNVLGSSGSLIPLFQRQLKRRSPLTVTHPDITRYFMTVHEAVQLVLHSMARSLECTVRHGRIIVLDMGEPIKIIDIARRMIRLSGLEPDRDVPIEIVGLRPGEKLYEELFDEREERLPSDLPGVFEAEPDPIPLPLLRERFDELARAIANHDEAGVTETLFSIVRNEPVPVEAAPTPIIILAQSRHPAERGWPPAMPPEATPLPLAQAI